MDVQASAWAIEFFGMLEKRWLHPSMSIVTRRKTVQEDRDTVMRMLRSHIEGIAYLKTHKEFKESSKQVSKNQRSGTLEGSYAIFKEDFYFHTLSDHEGPRGYCTTMSRKRDRRFAVASLKNSWTRAWWLELDKSGFTGKSYEQRVVGRV